jgi:hypothetical protein
MFPMPNLGGIGDIILIQNLKTGIYYIDIAIILLFLCLLHHNEIYTHTLKFINFVYSMNKESVNQMTINLTKGDMHRILYQGHQYAVGYSSINIVIHYPDPIIHVLDYYSDKIDSNKKIVDSKNTTARDNTTTVAKICSCDVNRMIDCCMDCVYMKNSDTNTNTNTNEKNATPIANLRYVEVVDKNNNAAKIYIPRTNLPIEIEDGVYLLIERVYTHRETKNSDFTDYKKVNFTLLLDKKRDISVLYNFISKCEKIYNKKIEDKLMGKIFIYEFLQSEAVGGSKYNDDDSYGGNRQDQRLSNILCSEYQLNTTKDLRKNCFFTDVEKIVKRIDFFINNKAWYEARGIPYQLGFLFYGPPGCGKTSTMKAIARLLDRHIINVNDIDKIKKVSDLKNIFYGDYINGRHIPTNKRIYVIDEFDKILDNIREAPINTAAAAMGVMRANLLNGVMGIDACDSGVISVDSDSDSRGNGSGGGGGGGSGGNDTSQGQDSGKKKRKNENAVAGPVSLMKAKSIINDADILTIMDGLVETSSRIIICTANDPSKISEAFKRPGRLDEHIEFTKCTRKMICDLLELFYGTKLSDEQRDKLYHSDNSGIEYKFSPAEVNKMCFNNVDTTGDTPNLKNMDEVINKMVSLVGCE